MNEVSLYTCDFHWWYCQWLFFSALWPNTWQKKILNEETFSLAHSFRRDPHPRHDKEGLLIKVFGAYLPHLPVIKTYEWYSKKTSPPADKHLKIAQPPNTNSIINGINVKTHEILHKISHSNYNVVLPCLVFMLYVFLSKSGLWNLMLMHSYMTNRITTVGLELSCQSWHSTFSTLFDFPQIHGIKYALDWVEELWKLSCVEHLHWLINIPTIRFWWNLKARWIYTGSLKLDTVVTLNCGHE